MSRTINRLVRSGTLMMAALMSPVASARMSARLSALMSSVMPPVMSRHVPALVPSHVPSPVPSRLSSFMPALAAALAGGMLLAGCAGNPAAISDIRYDLGPPAQAASAGPLPAVKVLDVTAPEMLGSDKVIYRL